MRVLYVTANNYKAHSEFKEAAARCTGKAVVRHSRDFIEWGVNDSIYFEGITSLEDARRMAGRSFDLILFDTNFDNEEIKAYLHPLVRPI